MQSKSRESQVPIFEKVNMEPSNSSSEETEMVCEELCQENLHKHTAVNRFSRRFKNPDMATCWLNACLQLVLSALDHNLDDYFFNSELGIELKRLQINQAGVSLDPTNVKDIIVTCEDTRIATRLSELQSEIFDPKELERKSQLVRDLRLNLRSGQQCVRDFFVALNENLLNWPDVYNYFAFQMIASTTCSNCHLRSESESTQTYEEMPVPKDQSHLKFYVEQFFNESSFVDSHCQEGCGVSGQGIRRTQLKSTRNSKFIILIFSRAVDSGQGFQLVTNRLVSTDTLQIR